MSVRCWGPPRWVLLLSRLVGADQTHQPGGAGEVSSGDVRIREPAGGATMRSQMLLLRLEPSARGAGTTDPCAVAHLIRTRSPLRARPTRAGPPSSAWTGRSDPSSAMTAYGPDCSEGLAWPGPLARRRLGYVSDASVCKWPLATCPNEVVVEPPLAGVVPKVNEGAGERVGLCIHRAKSPSPAFRRATYWWRGNRV